MCFIEIQNKIHRRKYVVPFFTEHFYVVVAFIKKTIDRIQNELHALDHNHHLPAQSNNRNTRAAGEICSKLTIKTLE